MELTARDLMLVVNGLLVPLVSYVVYGVREIRNELRRLNGRVISIETWQTDHEKLDSERTHQITSQVRAIVAEQLLRGAGQGR